MTVETDPAQPSDGFNADNDIADFAGSLVTAIAERLQLETQLTDLVERGALVANSLLLSEVEMKVRQEFVQAIPAQAPPEVSEARIVSLRACVANLSQAVATGLLSPIAFAAAEASAALDEVFLSFGLAAAKPQLVNAVHSARMSYLDPQATPHTPDIDSILAGFGAEARPVSVGVATCHFEPFTSAV